MPAAYIFYVVQIIFLWLLFKTKDRMYFDSFREVVKAVNSTLDRQEVLDLLVSNVAQVMGLKACAIRMLHGKKRTHKNSKFCFFHETSSRIIHQ